MPKKTGNILPFLLGGGFVLSSFLGGFFSSMGESVWTAISQGHYNLDISQIVSLAFGFLGVFLLCYGIYLKLKDFTTTDGSTFPQSFYKLRFHFKKEARLNIGTVGAICLLMGTVMIVMFLSFPPPPATTPMLMYNVILSTAIISGIAIIALGGVFFSNVLLDIKQVRDNEIRNQKDTYTKLVKDFCNVRDNMQRVSSDSLRAKLSCELDAKLLALLKGYKWVKIENEVMSILNDVIPDRITIENHVMNISYLSAIVQYQRVNTIQKIGKNWGKDLEKLYDDQKCNTETLKEVVYLLQEINGYSSEYMMRLIEDMTSHASKLKFSLVSSNINFTKVKARSEDDYYKLLNFIVLKMDSAQRNNENEEILERLRILYATAKKA